MTKEKDREYLLLDKYMAEEGLKLLETYLEKRRAESPPEWPRGMGKSFREYVKGGQEAEGKCRQDWAVEWWEDDGGFKLFEAWRQKQEGQEPA